MAGGGKRSQVEGSSVRWREAIACGGERLLVEELTERSPGRGAIAVGGSDRAIMGGRLAGGEERSQVERSDRRWRGAVSGGGERWQAEGSGFRWREAIVSGGERSQVEGSDGRWRGAVSGGGEQSSVQAILIEYTMGNFILDA